MEIFQIPSLRKRYLQTEIILNIKCSDTYDKKRILEDENLIQKAKDEINQEIQKLEKEYEKAEEELKDLLKN